MIDILIPVLARPERAKPLWENIIRATVNHCNVFFICSSSDESEIKAVREDTHAHMTIVGWEPGRGDYAKKINAGFLSSNSEFIFLGADDLCFCQGWDVHALATAEATGKSVIGTDDLGNPVVQRGDHATHLLLRRSYVSEQGASWDGPGIIYHEGYDHQYVDSELVAVAKQRGEWAFSHMSKVEHLHTFWGKSEHDSTYEKAMRDSSADHKLFLKRKREFA